MDLWIKKLDESNFLNLEYETLAVIILITVESEIKFVAGALVVVDHLEKLQVIRHFDM